VIVVTGASGSLGSATMQRLLADGHSVRGFARRPIANGVVGDLGDADAVSRVVAGADTVVHIGAAMKGDWAEHKRSTIDGTEHVIEAVRKHGVKQLVHISSMSVVDQASSSIVSEMTRLEPHPELRGAYTRAKLEAEKLVTAAKLPCVILRPGQIFGGGIPLVTGAVARHVAGRWLVLGDGNLELPLVYIDDVVDAIGLAIEKKLTGGDVIQIVDPTRITQNDVAPRSAVHIPRPLVFLLGKLARQDYRLKSALAQLHFESSRARELLGWQPRVGVREGIKRVSS
jgi:nucleoside-diphosphate-sugar epimerase